MVLKISEEICLEEQSLFPLKKYLNCYVYTLDYYFINMSNSQEKFINDICIFQVMIIRKIFEKNLDEEVHSNFLKFGRGEYKDKYLIEAKARGNSWTIKTGPEFANFLVKKCLEKVNSEVSIKGIIVTTSDIINEIEFKIVKVGNFQGIRKIQIDTNVNKDKILSLMDKYPRDFFALSFSNNDFTLKIKAKAPKSEKPSKENDNGPKAEFCSLKTNDESLVKELLFDVDKFKEVSVNHIISIKDIVYPSNVANLKPAEVREQSKRKGKIIRKVLVDGKEEVSEMEFVA